MLVESDKSNLYFEPLFNDILGAVTPLNAYLFPPSSTTVTGIIIDVTASSALSAKLAVAAGLKVVALTATEADWIEPEATTPVNNEPSPSYEPLNDPEPALANVDMSAKEAVTVDAKPLALVATEAV